MTTPQDLLKTLETKLDEALDSAGETIKEAAAGLMTSLGLGEAAADEDLDDADLDDADLDDADLDDADLDDADLDDGVEDLDALDAEEEGDEAKETTSA